MKKILQGSYGSVLLSFVFLIFAACSGDSGGGGGGTSGAPPSAPTGLTARVVGSAQIDLSWNAVDGATDYKLYSGGIQIYSGTRLNYAHQGLNPSTTYSYSVSATNADGESAKSAVVEASTQGTPAGAPDTPANLRATVISHTQIDLSWDAVDRATGYQLFNGEKKIYEGTADSYSHRGLSAATRYAYKVLAANADGTSAPSSEVAATTSPAPIGIPGIPANLRAVAVSDTRIDLSWDAVDRATGYKLYSGGNKIYEGANDSYSHTGLSANTEYTYTLAATNASGDSSLSAEVKATTNPAPVLRGRAYLTLVPTRASHVLRWNAVSGATGYELYHANAPLNRLSDISSGYSSLAGGRKITLSGNSYTFNSLDRSKQHYFVVVSKNSASGQSNTSAELHHRTFTDFSVRRSQHYSVDPTSHAFAVLKKGSIHAWGDNSGGGGEVPVGSKYISITGNRNAFAALDEDGYIKAWGNSGYGGTGFPTSAGHISIASSRGAFAALKFNGKISAWGASDLGGRYAPSDSGYTSIYSTFSAFAALKSDGSITAWGSSITGGVGEPTDDGYVSIASALYAFAALKSDGSIAAWGKNSSGGEGEPTDDGYATIYSNDGAFAAIKADGRITAWGENSDGGEGEPTDDGYVSIAANEDTFAALKANGSITAWGTNVHGGVGEPTDDGYVSITANGRAFAALKSDGSIKAWGGEDFYYGSDSAPSDSGYVSIFATNHAFAALKADGSITAWGHDDRGGEGEPTDDGYVTIYSTHSAFAALKSDGSISVWGSPYHGGSSRSGSGYTGSPAGSGYSFR